MSELTGRDNFANDYQAHREVASVEDVIARARSRKIQQTEQEAMKAGPKPGAPTEPAAEEAAGIFTKLKAVGSDIGLGIVETPRALVGAVSDVVHGTFSAADALATWLNDNVADLRVRVPATGIDALDELVANPAKAIAGKKNEVARGKSTTGNIVRDIAAFLIPFSGTNKALQAAGVAAPVAATAAGTVAGAVAADPYEEGIADLVQKYPALQNPVTEFLQVDKDDPELLARAKKGLENAGLGAMTEGFLHALRVMKSSRKAGLKPAQVMDEYAQARAHFGEADDVALKAIGDPKAGRLQIVNKADRAVRATETGVPDDIAAKGLVKSGEAGGKELYVNFARINEPDDVKKVLGQMADAFAPDIDQARRGVQSNTLTKKLADDLGLTVEDLLRRRKGEAFNAETATAARMLWNSSAEKLTQLAQSAAANPSKENLFLFRKQMATHYAIQAEVIAARTETARALQAWSIPVGGSVEKARGLQQVIDAAGGTEVSHELAKRIAGLAQAGVDPAALNAAIRKGWGATTMDAVKELYVNALLSSPTTHIVNNMSNTFVGFQQIYERKAAAGINRMLGGEGVVPGEAEAMAYGMVSGVKDAFRFAWKTLKTGQTGQAMGKTDLGFERAISSEQFRIAGTSLGKAVDMIGFGVGLPGRLLQTSDEFFKSIGYRMELHAQAYRQTVKEGLTGEQAGRRFAQLLHNPPESIKIAAADAALYSTFTNQPGWFIQSMLKARNAGGPANPLAFVFPFVRTPGNIARYSFERTPLAPLVGQWRADIMAGGARADMALARMATGSALMAAAADMASNGVLTGAGPDDPGEREALQRTGWQPYSLKVGDKSYSFSRTDPLGMTLGFAADMAELMRRHDIEPGEVDEWNEIMAAGIASIANTAINKTYMRGVAELVEMLADPERYSGQYINNFVSSLLVPSGVNAAGRLSDPEMKEAMDVWDAVQAKIPGLKSKLTPARNLWGEPRKPAEVYGRAYDVFSPIAVSQEKGSQIDREMVRLNMDVRRISKKTNFGGVEVNFRDFPAVYDEYVRLAGNELKHPAFGLGAKDLLEKIVSGKHDLSEIYRLYSDGEDGGKAGFIRNTITQFRQMAQAEILNNEDYRRRFPEFFALIEQKRIEKERARQMEQ